jgi:POT family proton-dependent oligopeptide transporter
MMDSVTANNRKEPTNDLDKTDLLPVDPHAGRRRIPDKFPPVALLILVVEVCYPLYHTSIPTFSY